MNKLKKHGSGHTTSACPGCCFSQGGQTGNMNFYNDFYK